jgi:hypothetical protein
MTFLQNVLISGLSLPSRRDEPKSRFSDAAKHHRKNQTEEISSRYLCHVRKIKKTAKIASHASKINLRHVKKFKILKKLLVKSPTCTYQTVDEL